MARKLDNYLKSHRKRTGFSQDDVAFLVGMSGGAKVSRHERTGRLPSLTTAFAYQELFGLPLRELFPGIYYRAGAAVRRRAQILAGRSNTSIRKQVALRLIAESGSPTQPWEHAA